MSFSFLLHVILSCFVLPFFVFDLALFQFSCVARVWNVPVCQHNGFALHLPCSLRHFITYERLGISLVTTKLVFPELGWRIRYGVCGGAFVRQNICCKPAKAAKLTVYAIKDKPEVCESVVIHHSSYRKKEGTTGNGRLMDVHMSKMTQHSIYIFSFLFFDHHVYFPA